jgi:hypothetical protein
MRRIHVKNAPAKDAVGLLEVLNFEILFNEHVATCPANGNRSLRHHHLKVPILASVVPCCDTGKRRGREGGRARGREGGREGERK